MPAVTPNKPGKRYAFSKSYKKTDTSYWSHDSFANISLTSRHFSRSYTMYDKLFSHSSRRHTNRISKNYPRHRVNEVERCTNMEQREQYRLLIERYCKTTLAETEQIFCKNSGNKENGKSPAIVISDTPVSKIFYTKPQSALRSSSFEHSFMGDDLTFKSKRNHESSVLDKSSKPSVSANKQTLDVDSQAKSVRFTSSTPHPTPTQSSQYQTPKSAITKQYVPDWFSPPSPYMSANFIKDLNGCYGRRERERKRKILEEETRVRLLRENRELDQERLSKLLEDRLRVKPEPEVVIPELTEDQECEVDDALVPHPQQQVLKEKFNISITRQHIATLAGLNWLNDEVINFYMELIVERSKNIENLPKAHAMNTFFYPKLSTQGYKSVRRWTKRVDIFSKDLVFYPIHLGIHWTLAVVDFRAKTITYLDSMGGSNQKCLESLKNYLVSESEDKKKTTLDISGWRLINKNSNEIPQQLNGSDCGVFTCTFAEFISRNATLSFHQNDMPLIRRTMVWEIINGALTR